MKVLRTQTTVRTCAVVVPVRVAALATQRNALRRAVIAIVSTILPKTSPGYEAVITVKMNHLPPHTQLKYEVVSLFVESGILTQ
jgi:RNase P protein component